MFQDHMMPAIERQYLPPLTPETSIAEADRARIYDIVRKQLADLLAGEQSYYPDGVQKDWQARSEDLDGFIGSISSLRGRINDPADILGDVVRHLGEHAAALRDRIKDDEPSDPIELPPALSPTTRDRNELYTDPNPFAPPMESLPRPRQEWPISAVAGGAAGGGGMRPERRVAPPIFFPIQSRLR